MGGKGTDIFGAIDQFSGEIEEASNATLLRLYIEDYTIYDYYNFNYYKINYVN